MKDWRFMKDVSPEETGSDGRMSAPALQNRFMIASTEHSERLGCGWDAMRSLGTFWAVSRLKIVIHRYPVLGENIVVRTWPNPPTATGVDRNYRLTDWDGRLLAEGMAKWTIVDLRDGKPVKADEFPLLRGDDGSSEKAIWSPAFDHFPPLEISEVVQDRPIASSDIDANHHVNNLRYLVFALDVLEKRGLSMEPIHEIQIQFSAPLYAGETVHLFLTSEGNLREVEGRVDRLGQSIRSFRCRIQ